MEAPSPRDLVDWLAAVGLPPACTGVLVGGRTGVVGETAAVEKEVLAEEDQADRVAWARMDSGFVAADLFRSVLWGHPWSPVSVAEGLSWEGSPWEAPSSGRSTSCLIGDRYTFPLGSRALFKGNKNIERQGNQDIFFGF